jgi:hypothetical protein
MSDLRDAARQALEALEDHAKQYPHMQKGYTVDAITALRAALAEEALQRLTDANQEIEAALEKPKFTLSCGCQSQYGGVPAYWERDGSTAFGMICEKHWHKYGARSEA